MKIDDNYFKNDAKHIVDMCFDAGLFKSDVTRNDMNAVEEFILFLFQSKFESYTRLSDLVKRINKAEKS